jgi:hypothetical protein
MSIIANIELQANGEVIVLHQDILKMERRARKENSQLVDISRTRRT